MKCLLELKNDFDKEYEKRVWDKGQAKTVWDMGLYNRFVSGQTFKDNLPTLFSIARENLKKIARLSEDNSQLKRLESWLPYNVFRSEITRKTKKNLRIELKNELKEKRIFFYHGIPHTTVIYKNPVIQSFFEFSLFYSLTKKIELSAKKAKTAFIRASKVALHLPLENKNEEETQAFANFSDFIQGNELETGYFDSTNLPTRFTAGRKLEYQSAIKMAKDGMRFSRLANHFVEVIKKEWIKNKVAETKEDYLRGGFNQNHAENMANEHKKELIRAIKKNVREALRGQGFTVKSGKIQKNS